MGHPHRSLVAVLFARALDDDDTAELALRDLAVQHPQARRAYLALLQGPDAQRRDHRAGAALTSLTPERLDALLRAIQDAHDAHDAHDTPAQPGPPPP